MITAFQLIDRSISHNEIARANYDPSVAAELKVECDDWVAGNDELDFWGTDEDGNEWRVHLALPRDAVVVEIMPDHLRASHRAAHNFGVYPHNGAQRYTVDPTTADAIIEDDEDRYAHLVKADVADYEYREWL